ncbi:MAG: hypothetical protein M3417_00340 [Actinomycetota bacterium]|nr:hypothetical protein [Actinomycetota bacterium]
MASRRLWNGVEASATPPRKAPTSLENPSASASAARPTAHAIALSTSSSGLRAAWCSQRRQRVARDEADASEQRHALDDHPGDLLGDTAVAVAPIAVSAIDRDDRADHHQILHIRMPTAIRPCRSSISQRSTAA